MDNHLVLFHAVSAGQNGPDLGSDEEQIVYLLYAIIDTKENKVIAQHTYHVRPSTSDINENLLSEQCREDYGLTEADIKAAPHLDAVLHQFDRELASKGLNSFCLVTDGPLAIRQCLFPEAFRKDITLPPYYSRFHDLRKEFTAAHPDVTVSCVDDMLKFLGLETDADLMLAEKHMQAMARILHKLICDEVKLHEPDQVREKLEQSIRSREDLVDSNCCVRARGLPWQASDQDIARFFIGLNVARGGVALCLSSQGRRNGEALVLFDSVAHRDFALRRHKHHIGNRYIEVYKATGEDFINVAGGNNLEAQQFLSRKAQVIIRMRGLPYDATAKQVIDFFAAGENACSLVDGEDGVLFVKKPDGRATGDAFVLLSEEEDADKALQKHKENMGSRYIELFRSTTAEVQQVLNRTMEKHSGAKHHNPMTNGVLPTPPPVAVTNNIPLIPHLPNQALASSVPVLPQQMITAGTRKDCIRLRGLPYEAQVEHILEFLGDHAKSIVYQGVHMVYNAQGQPSGEAFIQMSSESAAYQAAHQRHHHYMVFGKKQRYIEVFQCSGEDMNHVLTGNTAAVAALAASVAASPVKTSSSATTVQAATNQQQSMAAAALASGLLPPGMFTSQPQASTLGHGFDPNMAATFASQMQSPFLLLNPSPQAFGFPDSSSQLGLRPPTQSGQPQQQAVRPYTPVTTSSTADMSALFGLQAQQAAFFMNPTGLMPLRQQPVGLMAYNQALAAQQQFQLQQQQLLQNQLAAQRLFMTTTGGQQGLIGPRPAKRSFEQAFNGSNPSVAAVHGDDESAKRASYGLSAATISAGPTTYNR